MKMTRVGASLGIVAALAVGAFAQTVAGAAGTPVHDGLYETAQTSSAQYQINLVVGGNGTRVLGGVRGSGVSCAPSTSLISQDPSALNTGSIIYIKLPRALAISPSGAFTFSGNVTLTPADTDTSMSFTLPITWSGHFIKGKIVLGKSVAVIGSFAAPAICSSGTPTHFSTKWLSAQP